jgi:hypothetical protein
MPQQQKRDFTAQEVRQGDIVLKKPWQRGVFIAGLGGGFIVVIAVAIAVHFNVL